jgi:hypothetical protein
MKSRKKKKREYVMESASAKFVAGFFDGDGCVFIPANGRKKPFPVVTFAQSYESGVPPELEHIQRLYGGSIYRLDRMTPGSRISWRLRILRKEEVVKILHDLVQYCVLKLDQVRHCLEYTQAGLVETELYQEILCDAKENIASAPYMIMRVCDEYVAGLTAAEGSVGFYHTKSGSLIVTTKIYQNSCPMLLTAVRLFLGFGNVNSGSLQFSGVQTKKLFDRIRPHMVGQKLPQVELVHDFLVHRTVKRGKKRSPEDIDETKKIEEQLKKLKRK